MENATAPEWIRQTFRRYRRIRLLWFGAAVLGWLGFLGWLAFAWRSGRGTLETILLGLCFAAWIGEVFLRPELRAQRYGFAADRLSGVIARYEVSIDQPDSLLIEEDQKTSEDLRLRRIRTAPDWIRIKRRGCRLRRVVWLSPFALVVVFAFGAALWQKQMVLPLAGSLLGSFSCSLLSGKLRTRKTEEAQKTLKDAIEQDEYVSGACENILAEADQRASQLLR